MCRHRENTYRDLQISETVRKTHVPWYSSGTDRWKNVMNDMEKKSFRNCGPGKNKARDVIDDERRLTVHKVAEKCGVSKTRILANSPQDLNMNQWVPRLLTCENMEKRVELL